MKISQPYKKSKKNKMNNNFIISIKIYIIINKKKIMSIMMKIIRIKKNNLNLIAIVQKFNKIWNN